MPRVTFGQWAPDLPPFELPGSGVSRINNVIPHHGGYRPLRSYAEVSEPLDTQCLGAIFVLNPAGDTAGYAGDEHKLYKLTNNRQWLDISRPGGYSSAAGARWKFDLFNERLVATNFADPVQVLQLVGGPTFLDLSPDAPRARHLAVVHPGFLVLGNLPESPSRVRWSAIQNPASWPPVGSSQAVIVQSDHQELFGEGGQVQGIVAALYSADWCIIQERALWRVLYVGPPNIFQFDQVEGARGTPAPGSITRVGGMVYYLGEDGFYRFDGQASVPIGDGRVDRTFLNDLNTSLYHLVQVGVDPKNKVIMWGYPDNSATSEANSVLIYNWGIDRWARGTIKAQAFVRAATVSRSLDEITTSVDDPALPSLDSPLWRGGQATLAIFNEENRLAYLAGFPLPAEIETMDAQMGELSMVTRVRPLIEGAGRDEPVVKVAVGSRYRLFDEPVYREPHPLTVNGDAFARSRGRYHRALITIEDGDWSFAQGADVEGL